MAAKLLVPALSMVLAGCAMLEPLRALVRPPRFTEAEDRSAEIRLLGPSVNRPLGGASVRLWATVTNPNSFGFTLSTLRGAVFLQDNHAAEVDLPLGLPLAALGTETFPIEFSIGFGNLPGLADAVRRAINGQPLDYRLDGTVGVNAGRYGEPEFGPMTLLRGTVRGQDRRLLRFH
jgi:hypothetical protein